MQNIDSLFENTDVRLLLDFTIFLNAPISDPLEVHDHRRGPSYEESPLQAYPGKFKEFVYLQYYIVSI
jgi:hypothetical protein